MRAAIPIELVAFAEDVGAEGLVAVEGGRTRWETGGAVTPDARLVRAPSGVVRHFPEEMTVRAFAGTPVADLHATLSEAAQRTSLPERGGTIGGALSVGENHLDVQSRGRVRDALLQVTYVSAEGRVVTGGGPTVKNVSGFDLCRLLAGSLGTLGLIGEVILRTNPAPEVEVWLRAEGVDPFAVFDALYRPAALLWDGAQTWAHLEGPSADLSGQRGVLDRLGSWEEVDGPPTRPEHRWSESPARLRAWATRPAGSFVASVGVGTVWAGEPPPDRPRSPAAVELHRRVKDRFDPHRRLNPGRVR